MTDAVKRFIEDNIDLIEENNFKLLFNSSKSFTKSFTIDTKWLDLIGKHLYSFASFSYT